MDYWEEKIKKNVIRDISNHKKLNDLGYRVITVWECELKENHQIRCMKLKNAILKSGDKKDIE